MLKIDKEKFPSFEVMPFSVKDTIFSENLPDNKVVNVSLAHDYKDPIILIEFFQPQPNNDTYFHLFNQDRKIRLNLEEDQLKKVDETTKEEYLSLFPGSNAEDKFNKATKGYNYCILNEFGLHGVGDRFIQPYKENFKNFVNNVLKQPLSFNVHTDKDCCFAHLYTKTALKKLLDSINPLINKKLITNDVLLTNFIQKTFYEYVKDNSKPEEKFKLEADISKKLILETLKLSYPEYLPKTPKIKSKEKSIER